MGDVLSHFVLEGVRWLDFIALFCARQKPENIWHIMETRDLNEDRLYGRLDQSPGTEVVQVLVASCDIFHTTKLC